MIKRSQVRFRWRSFLKCCERGRGTRGGNATWAGVSYASTDLVTGEPFGQLNETAKKNLVRFKAWRKGKNRWDILAMCPGHTRYSMGRFLMLLGGISGHLKVGWALSKERHFLVSRTTKFGMCQRQKIGYICNKIIFSGAIIKISENTISEELV